MIYILFLLLNIGELIKVAELKCVFYLLFYYSLSPCIRSIGAYQRSIDGYHCELTYNKAQTLNQK